MVRGIQRSQYDPVIVYRVGSVAAARPCEGHNRRELPPLPPTRPGYVSPRPTRYEAIPCEWPATMYVIEPGCCYCGGADCGDTATGYWFCDDHAASDIEAWSDGGIEWREGRP